MIGQTVGSYRIGGLVGEGGMGAVYLGEHTLLGRKAAIKVLLPALSADDDLVRRFFNEARALTQIADPGIVQVFDFGYHTDGRAYIVMELLEGEAMDRRLARIGRFSPLDVLRLVRLTCAPLAAAHAKGIVHRDLKPENVFLVRDANVTGGERTKLLDFGIAKLSTIEPSTRTQTGMMMGTPVYMSPEQCRGAGELDERSDIYSLGCVMMTMLTGRPPFEHAASGELIVAHLCEAPPRADSRLANLPPVFDDILARCLAKSPSARFATATALAEALIAAEQRMLGSLSQVESPAIALPVRSSPTTLSGAAGQTRAPTSRRRTGLLAGFALAAATSLGVTFAVTSHARDGVTPDTSAPLATPASLDASVDASPDTSLGASFDAAADAPGDATPAPLASDAALPADANAAPVRRRRKSSSPPATTGAPDAAPIQPEIDRGS